MEDTTHESEAMALASNEVESAASLGDIIHDTWTQILELGIGVYLLANELGWVCIVPPLVAVCESHKSQAQSRSLSSTLHLTQKRLVISQTVKAVTEDLGTWHMAFSKATQSRITAIKAILDSMKNIKMMGVVENMEVRISRARDHELKHYVSLHRLLVAFFVSCE
jgi:ATP-binding cassette, subfamily C (CFTR/MRP), member 1